jgi:membrane peptidoglycan carboxypeptidase
VTEVNRSGWVGSHRSAPPEIPPPVKRLLRFVAVTAAAAILLSGTVIGVAVIGGDALHHAASAQELALPPISSRLQEPSVVYADDGKTVLATLSGPEFRQPITLSQVSKTLVTAVLDTEDHGFYVHGGFDVTSIVRAFVSDAQGGGIQGGSTIPQQLVKNLYLTDVRSVSRKIKEAVLADRLEQKYPKNEILTAYLNTIYLGGGAYGVQAAAEHYFQEPASRLDLAQSALLAGMISDPNGYDPILQPAAARDRREQVLDRMVVYHDITPAQEAAALEVPLPTAAPAPPPADAVSNYYVNQVKNFLLDDSTALGTTYAERDDALFEGGLKIITNLDPTMQAQAEQKVAQDTPVNQGGFVEGLVSVDPATGAVRALVGGTGTNNSQFDVMTEGERQPGSGFKLFTLLSALEQGYSVYDTLDSNAPCAIEFPGNDSLVANPIHNDAGPGGGTITLVDATANSVNCAYIRLAHEVGLPNVIDMAQSLGISPQEVSHKQYDDIPSVVIGSASVHPIEMAAAYAAVADEGVFHAPSFIDTVEDRTGSVIYSGLQPGHRVFSTQIAAEADVALRAVVTSGTGTAASIYDRPVAGKTGTTSNNVDAWFNGFTPQLETTVWMGNLKSDSVPIIIDGVAVYGADYPARTWHDYSAAVLADQPVEQLPAVAYGLLPPTRYVTSPSLVHDDVLAHNGGYYSGSGSSGAGSYSGNGSYNGYSNYNGYRSYNGYSNYNGYTTTPPTYAYTYSPPATTGYVAPPVTSAVTTATGPPGPTTATSAPPTSKAPPPAPAPAPAPRATSG